MRKILLHTFLAIFLASLIFIPALLSGTSASGIALIILLMIFFCAPFPTYLAVLLYNFLKKKIYPDKKVYSILGSTLVLLFIYHLCLVLYVAALFSKPWSYFIDTMTKDYTDEYGLPNIIAFLLIISIPLAQLIIEKVKRDLKEEQQRVR